MRAELIQGRSIGVGGLLAWRLMHDAGLELLPDLAESRKSMLKPTSDDLVEGRFARSWLSQLLVSQVTEHATWEGKVHCCCVMDTCRRRTVGWSINTVQDSQLIMSTLDMAISQGTVCTGGIVHVNHGVQFTSRVFTGNVWVATLLPSFGSGGHAIDNAKTESFW